MRLFWIYAKAMPVLHARESIHRINEYAAGAGTLEKESADNFIADLTRIASGDARAPEPVLPRPKSMAEVAHLAATSGITMA
jgi:hypothetical protein